MADLTPREACKLHVRGPFTLPAAGIMAITVAAGWVFRHHLHSIVLKFPQLLPAVFVALVVLCLALAAVLWGEIEAKRRKWLRRASRVTGLASLESPGLFKRLVQRFPDPLQWVCAPLFRTPAGQRLADDWMNAGHGEKPSRYVLILFMVAICGWILGDRMAGPLLGLTIAITLPLIPRSIVSGRAAIRRRRFGEQLPQALDSISAGLAAGLSFQQAIKFSLQELPDPVDRVLAKAWRRMVLGFSVEDALRSLLDERSEEALALVIEGVVLQRQFGGDLVHMLDEMAGLLRERVELGREVRALTTQGRLSALVVAGLVPVSAGILLIFNPRYIDVLFETIPGQALLIISLLLLFAGWWIISRMIRQRY
jgi:tight adherence protein B